MHNQWDHAYRLRPYYRNVGIACTAFFFCAWVGSVLAAYFNIDGSFARPMLAIVLFSVGWGGFTLLGLWLILAYQKYRLLLNDNVVCHVGILRTKSISLNAIKDLKWRRFPQGGSCVATTITTRIVIEFNNFTENERDEIIAYLRGRVADDRQTNWDSFNDWDFNCSPERARQQQPARRILIFAIFGFAAVFIVLWLSGRGAQFLVISFINILVAAWVLLKGRRRKEATEPDDNSKIDVECH